MQVSHIEKLSFRQQAQRIQGGSRFAYIVRHDVIPKQRSSLEWSLTQKCYPHQ